MMLDFLLLKMTPMLGIYDQEQVASAPAPVIIIS